MCSEQFYFTLIGHVFIGIDSTDKISSESKAEGYNLIYTVNVLKRLCKCCVAYVWTGRQRVFVKSLGVALGV